MAYQIDEKLNSFVKGKSIAIVGPSPHINDTNMGSKINQFDLVCRVNDVYPWGYEKGYGSKNDMCSLNCGTIDLQEFDERLQKLVLIKGPPKFLMCPVIKALGPDHWQAWSDDHITPSSKNLEKINRYGIPSYSISVKDYKEFYKEIGSEPNCGILTILVLLQYDIKEIFITGFSFYAQGNSAHKSYRPNYNYRGDVDYTTGEPSHPQFTQKYYFKNTLMKKNKDKIIVDSFLNSLLGLKHHRVIDV